MSALRRTPSLTRHVRASLPGPSRRITVEPIRVPKKPTVIPSRPPSKQPARPERSPQREPVPAR
jgi:hypothetical protein